LGFRNGSEDQNLSLEIPGESVLLHLEVIPDLQVQPESLTGSEEPGEPEGGIG
jgi:hypothetical protein